MLLTVDKLVDVLGCAERIRPYLHLKCDFKLMVPEFQHSLESILLLKSYRERNLRLDKKLRVLGMLQNLVKVRV